MSIGYPIEHLQQVLNEVLLSEWEAQGHSMGGNVVKDIVYDVKQSTDSIELIGKFYPYGNIQARGARWSKFPNTFAIQEWVKKRMNIDDEKKSKSIAFAIAQTFKREGMPTPGSLRFSSTGKRTDWVEEAFKKNEEKIMDAVRQLGDEIINVKINVLVNEWNNEINR